jgi:hypothetical protein
MWKMPAVRSAVTQEHVRNTQNKEIYLPQICTNAAYATIPTTGHVSNSSNATRKQTEIT